MTVTDLRQPTRSDDHRLVLEIAGGDSGALRIAYDLYSRTVHGVALGVLKDPDLAADITQDVFVRLWERHHRYDPERGSLKSFLSMDAYGRSLDLFRSRKAATARELADHKKNASSVPASTEELAMKEFTGDRVRTALATLPIEQRAPIAMAFFDGLTYRDIATVTGTPEGTVKSRIRSGMRHLQMALGAERRV